MAEESGANVAFQMLENTQCSESTTVCESKVEINSESGAINMMTGFVRDAGINFPPNSQQTKGRDSFIKFPKLSNDQKFAFIASSVRTDEVQGVMNADVR